MVMQQQQPQLADCLSSYGTRLIGPFESSSAKVVKSLGQQPVYALPVMRGPSTPVEVVISHSSKDASIGRGACEILESRGLRCWIAPRDIVPGEEWGAAIVRAIRRARVMVLIYTANSNESPQVRREVERAVARRMVVIPFRVEDVPMSPTLEYFISTPHWLDALTPPLSQHYDRLAEGIRTMLRIDVGRTPRPASPPPASPTLSCPSHASRLGLQFTLGLGCAIGAAAFAMRWHWRGLPFASPEKYSGYARRYRDGRATEWQAGS